MWCEFFIIRSYNELNEKVLDLDHYMTLYIGLMVKLCQVIPIYLSLFVVLV